jgi:nucleoid-associated protein YgaU
VPDLGLEFDVKEGEQTIEFTPTKQGLIPWSCWMGMLQGDFLVVAEDQPTDQPVEPPRVAQHPASAVPQSAISGPGRAEPATEAPPPLPASPAAVDTPNAKAPEPPPSPAPPKTYTIARGDTLSSIAKAFYGDRRAWRAIAKANPGLDPKKLRPGQVIKLPALSPDGEGARPVP